MEYSSKGSASEGTEEVASPSDIVEILKWRDIDGDAEFMIGTAVTEYPYLLLSVTAQKWYLYFFPEADVAGFHSLGDDMHSQGETHMPAGCDIWVPNYALVSGVVALHAAQEFLQTQELPTCLKWFEL